MSFLPLKSYPINTLGGKAQIIESIVQVISDCIDNYQLNGAIDLFMGANRLFLHLDKELDIKIGNEIDRGYVAFFKMLQDPFETDQLIDEIWRSADYYTTQDQFEIACKRREEDPSISAVELAALTYIVSRYSRAADRQTFSHENAIKGINPIILDNLLHLEERLEGVEFICGDYKKVFNQYKDREDIITWVDPPYVVTDGDSGESKETLGYVHSFTTSDQEQLIDNLISTTNKVIVSGYDNALYKRLEANGFQKYFVGLVNVSSSGIGRKAKEFIWINFELDEDSLPIEPDDE